MKTAMPKLPFVLTLLAACCFNQAQAKQTDAAKLSLLNPMGGELAANADGSIPAWDGGLKPGAAPISDNGNYSDPYASEQPLYIIDKNNAEQYKAMLSPGQMAMLKRFPDYRMPVYPSHRSVRIPQKMVDESRANVSKTELSGDGDGLKNFNYGTPFLMPTEALEVIQNVKSRFRGGAVKRVFDSATVQEGGQYTLTTTEQVVNFRETISDLEPSDNLLFLYKTRTTAPARSAGEATLIHESLDQTAEPRAAWQYIPGQRRVRRAPTIAYDSSARYSFGQLTSDGVEGFNGATDRYDWKLLGKQELLVSYNNYKIADKGLKYDDLLKPGHLNSDLLRYEKHRVWVVEATLKPRNRHIYGKRRFYVDEDSWQIMVSDIYDTRGELWRVYESRLMQMHDIEVPVTTAETTSDLMNGRYTAGNLFNASPKFEWGQAGKKADYTAAELRRWGK